MIAFSERIPAAGVPVLLSAALVAGGAATSTLALHLSTALAALALGLVIMLKAKGTGAHRVLGRIWVALMIVAAVSSFWLTGLADGLSVIHLLSVWTLIAMALAIYYIHKGKVVRHKRYMVGTYIGLVGAGIGALMPGRTLFRLLW